ncbi:hypothetical protein L914_20142 [Phytophthora nicotianae]|uniref:RxLR effector protein n=1 Tax=Phytophthora nicotianae TaxID=4792 RepID=W2M7Z1_PHYNI|nr:hypothetical protein L914_20142 [Phytophthora nicotianae]
MRLYYIALLFAVALLTTSDATVSPKLTARSLAEYQSGMTTSRLLRIDKAAAELDEERGATVAGIQNLVKSSAKQAQIQLWLAQKKSADAAFKLFELEKAGGRLFGMKEVLAWANHVTKVNKKNAGATMLEALLKHYDDAALARMIQSAQSSTRPGVGDLATKLQKAQFNKWMIASERPGAIEAKLKQLGGSDLWSQQDKALVNAYKYFIGAA